MAEETAVAEPKPKKKMSKKKKVLFIVLAAIVFVVAVLGILIASFGNFAQKGLNYKKVDGGYIVSYYNGAGGMDEDITVEVPAEYKGEPVIGIGKGAFASRTNITAITLPDTVKTIGEKAFEKCEGLTSLKLGKGVEEIDRAAFIYCTKLTTIRFPATLTSVGEEMFIGCYGQKADDGKYYFVVEFEGSQEQWDGLTEDLDWKGLTWGTFSVNCLG